MSDTAGQDRPDSSDLEAVARANKERAERQKQDRARRNREVKQDYNLPK